MCPDPEPLDTCSARGRSGVGAAGIRAAGCAPGTVETLAAKKNGQYLVLEADAAFEPPAWESRELGGVRLEQQRPTTEITASIVRSGTTRPLLDSAVSDLMLAMVAARNTQPN